MEELELAEERSNDLFSAISNVKRLFTFDLSNNFFSETLAQSILQMMNKYRELEFLCVDHCEMPDNIGNLLFGQCMNEHLQFLNISWSHLSGESLQSVVRVVS